MRIAEITSQTDSPYFYAETAFLHQGDEQYLLRLVESASGTVFSGIKFQIMLNPVETYGSEAAVPGPVAGALLPEAAWLRAIEKAGSLGLEVIALPIDLDAMRFCLANGDKIAAIELHSISLNEVFLLEMLGTWKKPVLLGVGGRRDDEIRHALTFLRESMPVLVHGVQGFPTPPEQAALGRIASLKEGFRLPVGYADHSPFGDDRRHDLISCAYASGARVFEIHIALEKGVRRIDYEAAVTAREAGASHARLEWLRRVLGDPAASGEVEQKYRARQKQLAFNSDFRTGHVVGKNDLCYLLGASKSDYEQAQWPQFVGKALKKDVKKGESVLFSHFGE